jgi:hypothetical protein
MKKERHVCARRRVGEPAVSEAFTFADGREVHAMPNKAWHIYGRQRDGEPAESWPPLQESTGQISRSSQRWRVAHIPFPTPKANSYPQKLSRVGLRVVGYR